MVQSLKKIHPVFLIVAGLYLLISLYRLQDIPPPWYDEMVHLNTAGHLASSGRIWCDFFTAKFNGVLFNGMPLHWILPAVFIRLFGMTLAGVRFFYVLLSALTLFGIYSLAKRLFDEKTALYSIALLASCYIFFHNSRQVMPQVPAALFSTMALLVFYTARDKKLNLLFILSGIFTAFAYLSHPTGLGVFFIITALFFYKKIPSRFYLLYLSGVFLAILPYIVYVAANFQEYMRQMSFILKDFYPRQNVFLNMLDEVPVRYFGLPPIKTIFIAKTIGHNISNEYFSSIKWGMTHLDPRFVFCEMAAKAPLILSLVYVGFKKFKSEGLKDLFLITLLYVLFMSFHPNKFGPYIYLVVPYLVICLSVFLRDFAEKGPVSRNTGIKRAIAALVMAAFLLSNLTLIYKELVSKKVSSYSRFIGEASGYIPKGSTVAAPAYFWIGMHKDYNFISANQVVYEIEEILRKEYAGAKLIDLPVNEQDALVKKVLGRHKIQYLLMTWHYWEGITEASTLAEGAGNALRRYLFYNAEKEKDYVRSNYYPDMPQAARFEDEVYEPPAGNSFNNVSEEYQKSLKIYRVKGPFRIF